MLLKCLRECVNILRMKMIVGGAGKTPPFCSAHFLYCADQLPQSRVNRVGIKFCKKTDLLFFSELAGARDVLLLSLWALVGLGAGASGQERLEFGSSYEFSVKQGAPATVGYQLAESQQVGHRARARYCQLVF